MAKLSEKAHVSKLKYINEYNKNNCKQFKIWLNKNTMADVIEWLDTKDNKQGYVIDLIRKDIIANQKMKERGNKMEYNNTQECFENTMEKLNFKCMNKNTSLYTKFLRSGEMLEAKTKDNTYRLRAFKEKDGDMVLNLSVTFKTLIEFKCYYFGYTCNECEYDSL